jgi:hypothetical protein
MVHTCSSNTWKAGARGWGVQGQVELHSENLSQKKIKGWECSSLVEHLLNLCKVLGSIPHTTHTQHTHTHNTFTHHTHTHTHTHHTHTQHTHTTHTHTPIQPTVTYCACNSYCPKAYRQCLIIWKNNIQLILISVRSLDQIHWFLLYGTLKKMKPRLSCGA